MSIVASLSLLAILAGAFQGVRASGNAMELRETPSADGRYAYELWSNKTRIWEVSNSMRFDQVALFGSGHVLGYAATDKSYRAILENPVRPDGHGVQVVVISPEGVKSIDEWTDVRPSPYVHASPCPAPIGMVMWPKSGLACLRVSNCDADAPGEEWWVYDAVRAKKLGVVNPSRLFASALTEPRLFVKDAMAIEPGLALVEWIDRPDYKDRIGVKYYIGILSAKGEPILSRGPLREGITAVTTHSRGENEMQIVISGFALGADDESIVIRLDAQGIWSVAQK